MTTNRSANNALVDLAISVDALMRQTLPSPFYAGSFGSLVGAH